MERYRSSFGFRQRRRRVVGESGEKRLERVVEDDFVVLPGMDRTMSDSLFNWRDLVVDCQIPRMEFQVMVEGYGLFTRITYECYANVNLKLAPPTAVSDFWIIFDVENIHPVSVTSNGCLSMSVG